MLAISPDAWLDTLNTIEFDQFSLNLALNLVVLELDSNKIILAIDHSKENLLDEYNLNHFTKTLQSHYQKEKINLKILVKSASLHCDTPFIIQQKRQDKLIESKIEIVKKSDKYQVLKKHFGNLKVIECFEIKENSD